MSAVRGAARRSDPYVDVSTANDPASYGKPADRAKGRWAAGRSMVLLKNAGQSLPLDPSKSTALIGPFAETVDEVLGPWSGRGWDDLAPKFVSLLDGLKAASSAPVTYTAACNLAHNFDPPNNANPPITPDDEVCAGPGTDGTTIQDAVNAANNAQQVVLALGENGFMSGESNSRSQLDLPGHQEDLLNAVAATGKPVVVVLFNGHPLDLTAVQDKAAASSPSRSRVALARCRTTTTTSRPDVRATRPSSGTRATATCRPASRFSRSATGSATRRSKSPT